MQVGVSFLGWKSFPFALPCSIYNYKPILWTMKISQTSKLVSTRRIITWKEGTANLLIIDGAPKKGLKENVREQILGLDCCKLPKVSKGQCERKSKYGQTPFTEKAAVRGHSETLLPRWNTTDTYIRALQRLTLVFHIQLCLIDRISVYLILL